MADTGTELALTPEAEAFVREWLAEGDTIEAHTSGSTGKPKPVRLSKRDMEASARATLRFFGLGRGSLLLLPLPAGYIAGKMQIVRALTGGCRLLAEPPSRTPFATVKPEDVPLSSMAAIVPSQAEGLMKSAIYPRLGAIIIGGAPIAPHLEKRIADSGANAYATYGMTETCSHVALRKLGTAEFKALPGFRFETDPRGCLVINSETLSFGTLVTNDNVELSSPTTFRWLGRLDNIINSGGVKINPEEVESLILPLLPEGACGYLTSRPSELWGEEAVFVTDSRKVTLETILPALGQLHKAKRPKAVIWEETIPLTTSGKIIRKKLK